MFNLKQLRKDLKLKQEDLSNVLGVPQSFISQVENGKDQMPAKWVEILAETYNITDIEKYNIERGELNKGVEKDELKTHMVRLLPITAYGGTLNNFSESVHYNDCEWIISPTVNADFAITVTGESMWPEYPNGSTVLIRRINENLFIEWGKAYVLDTYNGTILKVLSEGKKPGHIRCYSINPDQERFSPFEIPGEAIYGIYKVLFVMAMK